jgi:hypothetical protein
VAFTKILTLYQIYHPLHYSPSYNCPPFPGIVSTDIIFPFTYMHTQDLHHVHPPPVPHLLPFPLVPRPPGRICSTLLSSDFVKKEGEEEEEEEEKEKKMTFLVV